MLPMLSSPNLSGRPARDWLLEGGRGPHSLDSLSLRVLVPLHLKTVVHSAQADVIWGS